MLNTHIHTHNGMSSATNVRMNHSNVNKSDNNRDKRYTFHNYLIFSLSAHLHNNINICVCVFVFKGGGVQK